MTRPKFILATAILCATVSSSSSIAQAREFDQWRQDFSQIEVGEFRSGSIFDPSSGSPDRLKRSHLLSLTPSVGRDSVVMNFADASHDQVASGLSLVLQDPSKTAELAQETDLQTYQQLFIPQHRYQPGRQPFQPNQFLTPQPSAQTPGSSLATPSGYGLGWRSMGIGVGIQSRTRYSHKADGTLGFGIGFGNPAQTVGLQVGLGLVDLTDPFADGTLSLKLHRQLPQDVAIAIGGNGVLTWGSPDGGTSVYGVVTKRFSLKDDVNESFGQLTTSLGIGSGQFRSEADVEQGRDGVGLFGSVAIRLAKPVSGIVEWMGQDLNLGLSIIPVQKIPLVITPAVNDITGKAGDGARFVVGVGYGISF